MSEAAAGKQTRSGFAAHLEALLFCALTLWALYMTLHWCAPGYMARDSGAQLEQARAFEFWDDHPVLMALLWHYIDRIVPGPIGMLALMSGLCWAGLGLFFWALPGPFWLRAAGLLAVGFFPPVFSTLPIILKDPLMHGGLLVALGCMLLPARRGLFARSVLALLALIIALGARHNGAAAAWPLVALPLLRVPFWRERPRWLRLAAASFGGMLISYALTVGLDRALAPISHRTEFWQTVPTFDLAALSLRTDELLIEPETHVFAERMGLVELRRMFDIEYGAYLYYCIPFEDRRCVHVFSYTLDPAELRQLSDNWLRAIRQHPRAYLAHRFEFALAMLNVSAGNKELYYLEGAPHHELAESYPPRSRALKLMAFIERHIKWVGYRPWIYALLSLLLMPLSFVAYLRGRSALPLLLTLSGNAYLLSILLGASSTNYRYSVWTSLCAVLALITLVAAELRARAPAPGPARALAE